MLDTPSWFYSRRSTDWTLKLILARELPAQNMRVMTNLLFVLVYNCYYIFIRFLPRGLRGGFLRTCTWIRAKIIECQPGAILVSQGGDPPLPKDKRVIWETYFLPPQRGDCRLGTFCRGGTDYWIRKMDRYAGLVSRIAVRGTASTNLVKEMYPEYADKVVDLRFVQPEYPIAEESFVREKQNRKGPIRILFIGRESRRKGLPNLIAALQALRVNGVADFILKVVSTMRDGRVELPEEAWVDYYREVSHDEAMALMREAQIFVMPSRFESYGLVYLEAMASGCAVIVRKEEPQLEFIDYGRAGLAADSHSVNDIAEKLGLLINDDNLRMTMALAGLERYKSEFSQVHVRAEWNRVLNAVRKESAR